MKKYDYESPTMLQRIGIFVAITLIELPFSWLFMLALLAILIGITALFNFSIDSSVQGLIVFPLGIYLSNMLCYIYFKRKIYIEISIKLLVYIFIFSNVAYAFVIDAKAWRHDWAKESLAYYWIAFVAFVATMLIIKFFEHRKQNKIDGIKGKRNHFDI